MSSRTERSGLEPVRPTVRGRSTFRAEFYKSLSHWNTTDSLLVEQYRILRLQIPAMYLAVIINMLFLAFVSMPDVGKSVFVAPVSVGTLIAMRLVSLAWRRTRKTKRTVSQMRASMTGTLIVSAIIATGLYIWTYLLGLSGTGSRTYVALFTTLCTIGCAVCLSSLPLAAYIVIAIGTIPISISLLLTGDTVLTSMGANVLLIAPLIIAMIYQQHQQLCRLVTSRSEIAAEKLKVSDLAYRDALTGLANRRAFLEELTEGLSTLPRSSLAVVMIDLDGFKIINDLHGHQTGDALLFETARRFEQLSIGDALIARLGGDEFAVLLRGVNGGDDARARAARIVSLFDAPFLVAGHTFRLRASFGMAHGLSDTNLTLPLISQADLAMYEGKRRHDGASGRCRSWFARARAA